MSTSARRITRTLATVLVVAGLGLSGCGTEGPETGADVEDVTDGEIVESPAPASEEAGGMAYEGEYNQQFRDKVITYVGEQVTLSAEVSDSLTSDAFEIAGPADPLLIVEEQEKLPPVEEEQLVRVTGTVHDDFDVTVLEELGIDPTEELDGYEGEPYIRATSAEVIEQD